MIHPRWVKQTEGFLRAHQSCTMLRNLPCYEIMNVMLKNRFFGLNVVKWFMESLDGNDTVCNELMTVVRRRQQVGLWWGETRWEVWIFDSTDRQRTKVFCCCTSSMIHCNHSGAVALFFSILCIFPPTFRYTFLPVSHDAWKVMNMCIFPLRPGPQGWVCHLSSKKSLV